MSEPDAKGELGGQRLDRWLWFTRIFKSRTLATKSVENGGARITRSGVTTRTDKPSFLVKRGDVVTLEVHHHVRVLEVLAPGVRRGPASEAQTLFRDLGPREPKAQVRSSPAPTKRPDKHDRRTAHRLRNKFLSDGG